MQRLGSAANAWQHRVLQAKTGWRSPEEASRHEADVVVDDVATAGGGHYERGLGTGTDAGDDTDGLPRLMRRTWRRGATVAVRRGLYMIARH